MPEPTTTTVDVPLHVTTMKQLMQQPLVAHLVLDVHLGQNDDLERTVETLGQLVIGHPHVEDGRTITQNGIGSNCGEQFQNETFALRDFCWCEGFAHPEVPGWEELPSGQTPASGGTSSGCPLNFEHFPFGVVGTWYKYLGRCTVFSEVPEGWTEQQILADCVRSLNRPTR